MWSPRSIVCPLSADAVLPEALPSALHAVVGWAHRLRIPLHFVPWPGPSGGLTSEAALLHEYVRTLTPSGASVDVRTDAWSNGAMSGAAWQAYVARHRIDLAVLVPPTGNAPSPVLSVPGAAAMIADIDAAVLTLPNRHAEGAFTRILAPTDLTEAAVPTLHHAEALAHFTRAQLDVLHVLTRRQYVALTPADMLALDDAAATPRVAARRLRTWYHRYTHPSYTAGGSTALHVEQGDPVSTVTRVAQARQSDLIVLAASHHPRRTGGLSTITENVLRRTTRAMLIARPRTHSLVDALPPRAASAPNPSS